MRKLLSTSALIAPFLVGAALAQDAPATTAPQTDAQTETQVETESDAETLPGSETDPDVMDDGTVESDTLGAPADATQETTTDTTTGTGTGTTTTTTTGTGTGTGTDTGTTTDTTTGTGTGTDTAPATGTGTDTGTETDTTTAPATDPAAAPAVAPDAAPAAGTTGETIVREQSMNELRVDWITGTTVYSRQDENIGSIRDLIIDQETNTITAAILSVGGFLGIGAKQIAVRFDELEIDFDAREIHLDLTREEADAAPEYSFRDRTDAPAPPAAPVSNGMGAPIAPLD